MSQKAQADGTQKHFAVGRGLLAAAETLNFNMNEQRPSRPMGVGAGGMEGQDGGGQMPRRGGGSGGGSNLGSTMKLFASLGLSPSDLDALAEIPEEEISVETLPRILMQLKSRKGEAGERRAAMSSDSAYRGGSWEEGHVGRMGGPSLGQGSAKSSADFGYGSLQDVSSSRGYGLNYSSSGGGGGGGGGSRERPYSELSHHGGLGMGPSEPLFMQRRMGSPSNGKVQDFLGVMPPMFPHVCSLCDFDVHSTMEWNQHINGLRHAENRRVLLDIGRPRETPNLSAGLLGPAPMSSGPMGEMSSSWGGGGGLLGQSKLRSRVVVVKYDRKPLSDKTLFAFAERFGCLREHLILKNKAFLEMSTHEEALDVVNYYRQHPACLYGRPVVFYLSKTLMFIEKDERSLERPTDRPTDKPVMEVKSQGSKVVFFYHLPREDEKKQELLKLAERFGVVEKHLFLTDRAFIQLGSVEDAEMLVKYYTQNPLVFNGRLVRLNICTKYKTLNVNHKQGESGGDDRAGSTNSKPSSSKSSSSTKTREEKKEEQEEKGKKEEEKVKATAEEEEEEVGVSGVMEGEEDREEEQAPDEEERAPDGEEEEPERAECVKKTVEESGDASQGEEEEKKEEEEKVAHDVTNDTLGDVGELGDAKQGAESEGQMEAAETEASSEEHEIKEQAETAGGDLPEEEDFPENMEDFVTLDELEEDEDEAQGVPDDPDNTRRGGMRVVNIVGFRRGYQYLNELLRLAQPFGKVVKHLVLDLKAEAFLQFATEEEARAMATFYNSNITASVCGRPVRISHSLSYPTIQSGSSRVVYIGQIPNTNYSEEEILKLAEPYGNVKKYFLNRIRRECFLEMYKAEDAEKMAADYKVKPLRFNGKRLTLYVSRKYKQLKHGHQVPSTKKRANDSPPPNAEQPPDKKSKEEAKPEEQKREEEVESCDVGSDQMATDEKSPVKKEEQMETLTNQDGQTEAPPPAENKPSTASLPLPPYDTTTPIGVEHVKAGFYCHICFLFYSNEDTAKKTHCSSQAHYNKLQKHLEKEQSKTEKEVTTT
ncbi:matrin-3-like isoform X2 [Archocentrus centrarchus]|uniref:matrin-3-like isoform X2 n=1 Tax=Archocentrus centrarchus TaxID=63155 RepID=UPI0011EA5077|nr:matrin-3-like isoform X2 [Archocentrus centrarchus]